jgi:hypothetical protein
MLSDLLAKSVTKNLGFQSQASVAASEIAAASRISFCGQTREATVSATLLATIPDLGPGRQGRTSLTRGPTTEVGRPRFGLDNG